MKRGKRFSKEQISAIRERIVELRGIGKKYKEIAVELSISVSYVRKFCVDEGLTVSDNNLKLKKKCIEMRIDGFHNTEICAALGISEYRVTQFCKGVNPPKRDYGELKEQREIRRDKATEKYISMLEKYGWKDIYRSSGKYFTGVCTKCGHSQSFCIWSLKQGHGHDCNNCKEIEKAAKIEREEERKRQNEAEREHKREERILEQLAKKESRKHKCPVCGRDTYRKIYCSSECAKTAANKTREMKRRIRISKSLIDHSITLKRLYKRDNGKCQLCGGKCDYSDFVINDGAFIVGDNYPSIDHIVPLSKGGSHSWENVQLAHWLCNTKKGNSMGSV